MTLTYQQRNVLAEKPAVTLAGVALFTVPATGPPFVSGVTSDFGTMGTDNDGMLGLINSMLSTIGGDSQIGSVIDGILAGVPFVAGALEAEVIDPLLVEHGNMVAGLDTPIGNLATNSAKWSPLPVANYPKGAGAHGPGPGQPGGPPGLGGKPIIPINPGAGLPGPGKG
jgi:hypothetical protein